ncbi:13470_t:CDS:2 [Entrophospora sp. SA101]|nr:13470_t:CDS:2 [Entrophospora sp. SA101]CAJ0900251.1 21654_t:CDS:2 [Entrophospora sp. SA101]CAJ0900275.1 21657_t:CDS:2 [Entrophospora sp. SA101]
MLRNKRRRDKKEDDEDNDEEDNDKEEEDDKDEVEEDKDEEDKDDKVEDGGCGAWKNKYVAMDPVSVVNVIDLFVAVGFAAEKNCIGLEYLDINI